MSLEPEEAVELNRRSWDERTPIHLRSTNYQKDLEKLRCGGVCLTPPVSEELGNLEGKRLLHLQCHIGTDSLSFARLGAEVTGLDFSEAAIASARRWSDDFSVPAQFLVGDAMRADERFPPESFDFVVATIGILCWIPDMRRWIASAGRLLRPGGRLYLCDAHPFADVFESQEEEPGIRLTYPYFQREAVPLRSGSDVRRRWHAGAGRRDRPVPASARRTH